MRGCARARSSGPVSEAGFAALMESLRPFETKPLLAVGVSGGADSLALCLLADVWARRRDGTVLALTVDHRLRPGSFEEATRVGADLSARGIRHRVLVADEPGPPGGTGIQSWARRLRHRLLAQACREAGGLHLLLAHHMEDQAETVTMRLSRGSGPDGLAGMSAIRETPDVRLLRPLLAVPKARLIATCRAFDATWIEDPSNADARFGRARTRAASPALAAAGLEPEALALTAQRCAELRRSMDALVAEWLATWVEAHPEGYATLHPAALTEALDAVVHRGVSHLVAAIGAGARPIRQAAIDRLVSALASRGRPQAEADAGAWADRTLGGSRIALSRGRILVCRDAGAVDHQTMVEPGGCARWDQRFDVAMTAPVGRGPWTVRSLGSVPTPRAAEAPDHIAVIVEALPGHVRASLPVIVDAGGRLFLPGFGGRPGFGGLRARFAPAMSFAPLPHHVSRSVVCQAQTLIS